MLQLHKDILTKAQTDLFPAIRKFRRTFGLVGGTAVALQIGHRESIDFDMFPKKAGGTFDIPALKRKFQRAATIKTVLREVESELTFLTRADVKVTFYDFPYTLPFNVPFSDVADMPDLLTLAAMKGFAIGQRAKWKDYLDIYFILKNGHTLNDIASRAKELFQNHFNEKLLRSQLSYFDDIDYREQIVFKPGFEVRDEEVKATLVEYALAL